MKEQIAAEHNQACSDFAAHIDRTITVMMTHVHYLQRLKENVLQSGNPKSDLGDILMGLNPNEKEMVDGIVGKIEQGLTDMSGMRPLSAQPSEPGRDNERPADGQPDTTAATELERA